MADDAAPPTDPPPAEEGEAPADGEAEEDAGPPELSEFDILKRLGRVPLDEDSAGMKGFFMNTENYIKYKVVEQAAADDDIYFSGKITIPYVLINKQEQIDDVKKVGFYSDFHAHMKDIEKYPLPELLLIRDHDRKFGDNFVWCQTKKSFEEYSGIIKEMREKVQEDYEAEMAARAAGVRVGGGDAGEGGEEGGEEEDFVIKEDLTVFVEDRPITPRKWESETMEETQKDVDTYTVHNSRPLIHVQISKPRKHFGVFTKFNDTAENSVLCKPQKDPNFALQRKEIEIGVQAVIETSENQSQTTWHRPINNSAQYNPTDFISAQESAKKGNGNGSGDESATGGANRNGGGDLAQIDSLTEFLTSVSTAVEEALQQNETVDIFKQEFANLGEEDIGFGSKSSSDIKEIRNFHDVTYTKGKRIESVRWVPNSTSLLAVSCYDASPFDDHRVDTLVRASTSHVLLWSFADSLAPHTSLNSPYDVSCLIFYPSDKHFLVGGLASGQLCIWKFQPSDFNSGKKESKIQTLNIKMLSVIDESHKKPITSICWLPAEILIEKKGKTSAKNPKDGPQKYLATIAGDGQFLLWDFESALEALATDDPDFQWKPVHRVQLQRQDSGTEMGCCHLLYRLTAGDKNTDGEQVNTEVLPSLGHFWASSEEGELVLGDWCAKGEEDRKPEFSKLILEEGRYSISKTFRPMLSLERSPMFPNLILAVTDWGFFIYKEGLMHTHLFASPPPSSYFTCGVWSPTRPSVIYLGRTDGGIDIWDFSDQSHKPSLFHSVTSAAITSMAFSAASAAANDAAMSQADQQAAVSQLAVGDVDGHLHVLVLPKNLVRSGQNELDTMKKFLESEEVAVDYFCKRRAELREEIEKRDQEQAAGAEEGGAGGAAGAEDAGAEVSQGMCDKEIEAAEAMYKRFEMEQKAQLAEAEAKAKSPKRK